SLYLLARIVDQEKQEGSDAAHQKLMEQILAVVPNNLHVLLDRLRDAVRRSDRLAVQETLAKFKELSSGWSEQGCTALASAERELAGPLGASAVTDVLILGNTVRAQPGYARGAMEVDPPNLPGTSIQAFIRLKKLQHAPSPPDT